MFSPITDGDRSRYKDGPRGLRGGVTAFDPHIEAVTLVLDDKN